MAGAPAVPPHWRAGTRGRRCTRATRAEALAVRAPPQQIQQIQRRRERAPDHPGATRVVYALLCNAPPDASTPRRT